MRRSIDEQRYWRYPAKELIEQTRRRELSITEQDEQFGAGKQVLVAYGDIFTSRKWPASAMKLYDPCKIVAAKHSRYPFVSGSGRIPAVPFMRADLFDTSLVLTSSVVENKMCGGITGCVLGRRKSEREGRVAKTSTKEKSGDE